MIKVIPFEEVKTEVKEEIILASDSDGGSFSRWDYPFAELDYLLEDGVEAGLSDTFTVYNKRLWEIFDGEEKEELK